MNRFVSPWDLTVRIWTELGFQCTRIPAISYGSNSGGEVLKETTGKLVRIYQHCSTISLHKCIPPPPNETSGFCEWSAPTILKKRVQLWVPNSKNGVRLPIKMDISQDQDTRARELYQFAVNR
jgi:hypothetical protein